MTSRSYILSDEGRARIAEASRRYWRNITADEKARRVAPIAKAARDRSPWNDAKDRDLRDMWAIGLSISEIGERMDMTRNQIVGRAHRLKLPPRPSPIKRAT